MKTRKNLMVLVLLSLFLSVGVADSDVREVDAILAMDMDDLEPTAEELKQEEAEIKAILAKGARGEKLTEEEKALVEMEKMYAEGDRLEGSIAKTKESIAQSKESIAKTKESIAEGKKKGAKLSLAAVGDLLDDSKSKDKNTSVKK